MSPAMALELVRHVEEMREALERALDDLDPELEAAQRVRKALGLPEMPKATCSCCGCTGDVSPLGVYRLMTGPDSKALHCQECYIAWYDTTETDPRALRDYVLELRDKARAALGVAT